MNEQTAGEYVADLLFYAKFHEAEGVEHVLTPRTAFKDFGEAKKIRKQVERIERWRYATAFRNAAAVSDIDALKDVDMLLEKYGRKLTYTEYLEDRTGNYET